MNLLRYSLLVLILALFACEETIILDVDQAPTKIVIEGMLTNREKDQYVKVTRTVDFYSTKSPAPVVNATVKITSSDGKEFSYVLFSPGVYVPLTPFAGEIGKKYTLSVAVDGKVYTSEDELFPVTPIDSLGYSAIEKPSDDQIASGHTYDLLLYFREPRETKDYYMFKYFRNDSLVYNALNDVYIASDDVLGETISGFPASVNYGKADTARLEMFSLSRFGYVYYSDLINLLFSDGGLFGPVPANPRSNFDNGALGFFQVSAVTTSTVIINK